MARGINKLSAKAVLAAKEPGLYGDGGNLYLQVADVDGNGPTKSWILRYMVAGRARKMGLGSVNDFSLAEARERARLARQQLADGIDPIEARLAARDAARRDADENITFKAAAEKFIDAHEASWRNEKHRAQWRSTLKAYAYGSLGDRPVKALDAALINGALASIWKKKPETASRVRQRIERVIQWIKDGKPQPAAGKAKRVTHHPALPWQEIPAFMAELRERNGISARALEFLILTAARTGEVIGAKWDEIDLHAKVWTIPADRMKAGKEHRVPLSDRAIQILSEVPAEKGSPYVFPGTKAKSPLSNMSMLEMVRGMRRGITVHGFRASFKTWASEATNHPNIVSEAALAHTVKDAVEKAYRRGELIEKRARLMNDWAAYCSRPTVPAGNVTPLRAA
jgi:integrase